MELFFATEAQAQAADGPGFLFSLAPILGIVLIMYFLMIRPQQQRVKKHREMVENIRRGDSIVSSGGLVGLVTKIIDDREIEVEIAPNTRVRIVRSMVSEVRVKGEVNPSVAGEKKKLQAPTKE